MANLIKPSIFRRNYRKYGLMTTSVSEDNILLAKSQIWKLSERAWDLVSDVDEGFIRTPARQTKPTHGSSPLKGTSSIVSRAFVVPKPHGGRNT